MARPKLSKHLEVIETLQSIQKLIQNLMLPVDEIQANSPDREVHSLYDHLRNSLGLLYGRAKELCEDIYNDATIQERSVCAPECLEKCQGVCNETWQFLKMIEEARAAQFIRGGYLLLPSDLVDDDQLLRDFTNGINRLIGQMEVFNRVFVAARKINAYNTTTSPTSADLQAAVQACFHAQIALVDLVRKVEEVDSMIGKMPPACETYLDIPSHVHGEKHDERNHRMFIAAARTIQKFLGSWTETVEDGDSRKKFDVYRALTESIKDPTKYEPDLGSNNTREFSSPPREASSTDCPSPQRQTRKSSLSQSRSGMPGGPKPRLQRNKSVKWDPALDEKHGVHEPAMPSSRGRYESYVKGLSSYWDGISEAGRSNPNLAKALDAIEFVLGNIRPWCLDLVNTRCDLYTSYDHAKEYNRLVEMLMSDVLEKLDGLCIESDDIWNRQTRKRLANETNELLNQMDLFILEFRGNSRDGPPKQDPNETLNSPVLPPDEHGFVYNRIHISPGATCLGKIEAWLTKEELAAGGRRTVQFEAKMQDRLTGATRHVMLEMPIYVQPGSKSGTWINAGYAWCRDSRSRTPDAYWTVVLMLDSRSGRC